jgi:hypothetical protein
MSHFSVLVIGDNVEEQLAPYHEYESTGREDQYVKFVEQDMNEARTEYEAHKDDYPSFEEFMEDWYGAKQVNGLWGRLTNPNAKWDWWSVGGRWQGHLLLKNSRKVDVALKGEVDFETMRNAAGKVAAEQYDAVHKVIAGTPECESWDSLIARLDVDKAREIYFEQERVKKFREVATTNEAIGYFAKLSDYECTREEYIENARKNAISTYAMVEKSKWYEKGQMGWFGVSSNEDDDWVTKFNEKLDSLPDDTLLTVVDCHI